jgi:hypothetical protein
MRFPALALLLLAQPPLPELKTEATDGGSAFIVRNVSQQPLTAFLIELVNYPGSFYTLWQDETTAEPVPPGGTRRISVSNMTVGAVPEYVKLQAALYADGSSSGVPERVAQLFARRKAMLETTRDLIARLEKAQAAGTSKSGVAAELKQWAESIPQATRANRDMQTAINQTAARDLIGATAARVGAGSVAEALTGLRTAERTLAGGSNQ